MTQQKDILIIGAGLTGLTTAFYLQKQGKNVLLIEKENRTGGSIRTYRENGYIIESGPNTGTLSNPEITELFENLEGCTLQTARKEAHKRLILLNGKFQPLPNHLTSAIFTPLFTWKDKGNILLEPFREKGKNPDESVGELTLRRLGKSYLNYAVDPFVSGIYAGDPFRLTTRYALPKLYNLEQTYGSFIRGAFQKARQTKTEREKKATNAVFSVEGGLENLIQALTRAVGPENIILDADQLSVSGSAGCWNLSSSRGEWTSPAILSTVGSHALPSLFPFVPESLMSRINNLCYAPIIQVAVGLPLLPGVDFQAFGGLIPSVENRKILGILYPSSCFEGRCPQGKALLSVFLGGIKHPEIMTLSDPDIEKIVLQELSSIYGIQDINPDFLRVFRHRHAIPQYESNTGERLSAIDEFQRYYPGITLLGNLKDGIGMADRVRQATPD